MKELGMGEKEKEEFSKFYIFYSCTYSCCDLAIIYN